jgi:hypothetical protein
LASYNIFIKQLNLFSYFVKHPLFLCSQHHFPHMFHLLLQFTLLDTLSFACFGSSSSLSTFSLTLLVLTTFCFNSRTALFLVLWGRGIIRRSSGSLRLFGCLGCRSSTAASSHSTKTAFACSSDVFFFI